MNFKYIKVRVSVAASQPNFTYVGCGPQRLNVAASQGNVYYYMFEIENPIKAPNLSRALCSLRLRKIENYFYFIRNFYFIWKYKKT